MVKRKPARLTAKFYRGKRCPNQPKGKRCSTCGQEYVCMATRKRLSPKLLIEAVRRVLREVRNEQDSQPDAARRLGGKR